MKKAINTQRKTRRTKKEKTCFKFFCYKEEKEIYDNKRKLEEIFKNLRESEERNQIRGNKETESDRERISLMDVW